VDTGWIDKTGERNAIEESMLEFSANVDSNSRLACQIKVAEEPDGLVVRNPKSQG
jgi:2Fe-2S ferredoxin